MNEYINMLFEALAAKGDFNNLDRVITEETNRQLTDYQTKLPQVDYEQIRDVAFSVSAIAKKESFKTGFKTAMNLILECRDNKQSL